MSTNWKDIGKNSGNMQHNRNVKINKLDYEKGKWNSIYDISGISKKGYTFDICGENIVVGVSTGKPFSRLSLGTSTTSGEFNPNDPGQLAAIAVNETSTGGNFKGVLYDSTLTNWENTTSDGLKFLASTKNILNIKDPSAGKLIIGNDNVITIGGEPTKGNSDNGNAYVGKKINNEVNSTGNSQIVLDIKGSVKTNGYINFYNYNDGTGDGPKPNGDFWDPGSNTFNNIPRGSMWISPGQGTINGQEGLYFKRSNGAIQYIDPTGAASTSSSAGAFDWSGNPTNGGSPFIIQKSKGTAGKSGGINIKLDGLEKDTPDDGNDFNNLLTLTRGNLAVCGISGELRAWPTNGSPLLDPSGFIGNRKADGTYNYESGIPNPLDVSGGLLWIQRQLAIGPNKYDKNWSVIDMQTVPNAAAIMSYNQYDTHTSGANPYLAWKQFTPISATNAIILLNKGHSDDGQNTNDSAVGNIHDCSNSIIIGNSFKEINTPNSFISNNKKGGGQIINDVNGFNIVFGTDNELYYSPFTIMFGKDNKIKQKQTDTSLDYGGGNLILGEGNIIDNSGDNLDNINVAIGISNKSGAGSKNVIIGENNESYGNFNILFGKDNNNGIELDQSDWKAIGKNYSGNYSFIHGQTNKVLVPHGKTTEGVFIAGDNNTLDVSGSSLSSSNNTGYVLLGSYAGISGENPASPQRHETGYIIEDLSNIKFAFGTREMYDNRATDPTDQKIYGGNVFTIDASGNTHIYGNLIVDGNNVILRTSFHDVSDNNLSLNYPGTGSQEGGGITIMGANPSLNKEFSWTNSGPSDNCWDTNGSDISTNRIFATDISCVDLSASFITAINTLHFKDGIVKSNGNMGVGDTNPDYRLTVSSNGSSQYWDGTSVLIQNKNYVENSSYATLELRGCYSANGNNNGNTVTYGAGIRSTYGFSESGSGNDGAGRDVGDLHFWTHDGRVGGHGISNKIDTMRITANGKVSIPASAIPMQYTTGGCEHGCYAGDVSSVFFVKGRSVFNGDISCNDISCVDISCVDISGVNAFFTGDISCNGKLTVGGLIDPTGLIFEKVPDDPCGDLTSTNKAGIWYETGATYLKYKLDDNVERMIPSKAYVDQGGSGQGASATANQITVGSDTANVDTRVLLFTDGASLGGYKDVSGNQNIKCNPSTATIIATTFSGALTGDVTGDVTGNADTATKIASITNTDIVQLTETQTLTNKTLTSPTITGTGAIAGTFTGDVTGDVTGNADTATKIASITNTDIVQLTETQTLTNKTLTSPTITGTGAIAGTFTGDVTGDVTGNADTATKIASITNTDIVQLTETQTLTNKTLTSPTITGTGAIAGSFTGDVTGNADTATKIASITNTDIVQLTETQTLTNKTLTSPTITGTGAIAGSFTGDVTGNADTATKIASITNTDIVQLTETQTLTNKTLTSPTITGTGAIAGSSISINPNNAAGGALTITNTPATQSSGNLVSITGVANQTALNIVTGDLKVESGEVMTTKISYTDGDDAITIADGGGCTFAQDVSFNGNLLYPEGGTFLPEIFGGCNNQITIGGGNCTIIMGGSAFLNSTVVADVSATDISAVNVMTERIIDGDGDDAITIADGGGCTFAQNITVDGNITTYGALVFKNTSTTLTAAELLQGYITAVNSGVTLTLPTASSIVSSITNAKIGSSFRFLVSNRNIMPWTLELANGTNTTLKDKGTHVNATSPITLSDGSTSEYYVVVTAVSTPAVDVIQIWYDGN